MNSLLQGLDTMARNGHKVAARERRHLPPKVLSLPSTQNRLFYGGDSGNGKKKGYTEMVCTP